MAGRACQFCKESKVELEAEEARLNVKGEERGRSWRRPASRNISFAVNEA